MSRRVLITGCSSGIGLDAARRMQSLGWQVVATCRKPEDIAARRAEGIECHHLELADEDSVARLVDQVLAGGPLGITEAMLRPTLLPTYLRNNWGRDWGGLQKFTEIIPAPAAELDLGTARRSGLYDPAPMRSSGY